MIDPLPSPDRTEAPADTVAGAGGVGIRPRERWLASRTETERAVLLLCVATGLVRMAFALFWHPAGELLSGEMAAYFHGAQTLGDSQTAWFLPSGLSALLAVLLRAFGSVRALSAIGCVLGGASAALVPAAFLIGRRLGGERVGKLAAIFAAFDVLALTASGYLLPDILAAEALAAAVVVFDPGRRKRAFAAGLLAGIASWFVPRLLVVGMFWLAALAARRRWQVTATLALGLAVVVAPVSLVASHETGHLTLLAPSAAAELPLALCPARALYDTEGLATASPTTAQRAARGEPEARWGNLRVDGSLLNSGASVAVAAGCLAHAGMIPRLLENVLDAFAGAPTSLVSPWPDWNTPLAFVAMWGNLAFCALALLGLVGLALKRHEESMRWLVALPLGAMLVGFPFLGGGPRFRLPWDVLLVASAAQGWVVLAPRLLHWRTHFHAWPIWSTAAWDTWKRVLARWVPNRLLVFLGMWAGLELFGGTPMPPGNNPGGRVNLSNRLIDGFLRFDAHWYWQIAAHGYDNQGAQHDTAFFPLYPLAARAVGSLLGGDYYAGGLIVSNVSFLFACVLLFKLISLRYPKRIAERALLLMLVFPFSFVFSSMYTESLFLLMTVGAFYFGERERWVLAGFFAAAAGATRIPGILVTGGLGVLYLEKINFDLRRIRWPALAVALGTLGTLGQMGYLWWRFGDPLAFMIRGYVVGWSNPFTDALNTLNRMQWSQFVHGGIPVIGLTHLSVLALGLIACVQCCRKWRWAYGLWGIATLLVSANVWVGLGRYGMVVFPLYIEGAVRLRRTASFQAAITLSTLFLAYLMLCFASWHFIL